jgi:hypothetical protein
VDSGQRRLPEPSSSTDQYLAAILDELRTLRAGLVQDPPQVVGRERLVTEPAPDRPRKAAR